MRTGGHFILVKTGITARFGPPWFKTRRTMRAIDALTEVAIAGDLGCTPAQLAIAWCLKNPNVSTVITGARRVEQIRENMAAADVKEKLTEDVMSRIDELTDGAE